MGMAALFIIPWLLIGGIPLALLALVIVRGLTLPRGLKRSTPAVCGRCRHGVASVSPETPMLERCPECGTPYTVGGVLTLSLAKKTRPGMVVLILCWTVLAGTVTMFGWGIAGTVAATSTMSSGMQQSFSQSVGAVRTDGGSPTSEPGFSVRFDADLTHQWTGPATAGTITLTVRPDSGPSTRVEIDAATGSWTLPSTGDAGALFDVPAAEHAFAAAGIDETTAWAQHEAGLLAGAVAFLRGDPATAVYDVLANPTMNPGASVSTTPFGTTVNTRPSRTIVNATAAPGVTPSVAWYPAHLAATAQSGNSASGLSFGFESDTVDQFYTGTRSVHAYDGTLTAAFTDDGSGPALSEVTITVRPPEGWPATMVYDPVARTASITRGTESSEATPASHDEAILALAGIADLTTESGDPDPGLPDLAALIGELASDPASYDAPVVPAVSHSTAVATPGAGTPPGDGQPDGGLVTTVAASQNFNTSGMMGNTFPVAIAITMGVGVLIWVCGVVAIVLRRFSLYPERALLGIDDG